MLSGLRIVFLLLVSQALIFNVLFYFGALPSCIEEMYAQDKTNALAKSPSLMNNNVEIEPIDLTRQYKLSVNPFTLLDAYPNIPKDIVRSKYDKVHMAIKNEDDYCERVDMHNILNPRNMFEAKNFFTDFRDSTIVREKVMTQIGNVLMEEVTMPMSKGQFKTPEYAFDMKINNFYVNSNSFHKYHEIGKNYLCQTQMFNHILGHKSIFNRDEILEDVAQYAEFYTDMPQCFNRDLTFPQTFRLHVEEECRQFFDMIQSDEYFELLEKNPVQYLLAIEFTTSKVSEGLYPLDDASINAVNRIYDHGINCGQRDDIILVQKYMTNPLLIDKNRFDFTLYMFIASTNPMIVYYHDGYVRVLLNQNNAPEGDNAVERKKIQYWDFAKLEEYILEAGIVNDNNWLDNYFRPAIKKALMHLVRATSSGLWKQSNIHELYSVDFMMDDNLDVWFIESNPTPQMEGMKPEAIERMLLDMFEIQYAYYHSRMKRVLNVIYEMQDELNEDSDADIETWQDEYQEAVKNRIEPEYQISEGNTWSLFIDQNLLPSSDAYSGFLDDECLDSDIDEM